MKDVIKILIAIIEVIFFILTVVFVWIGIPALFLTLLILCFASPYMVMKIVFGIVLICFILYVIIAKMSDDKVK